MSKIDIAGAGDRLGRKGRAKRQPMDQMNVSITDRLAGYVRKKVKSGRYNNASEVVREALRRMEDEDARAVRLAKPTAEDILTDLTEQQLDGIRRRVRAGIESIDAGKYTEYDGREGLKELADGVKARGRRKLPAREDSGRLCVTASRKMRSVISTRFFPIGRSAQVWGSQTASSIRSRSVPGCSANIQTRGRLRKASLPGVKCFPAGKYLIYYRATRQGTDILHVFHGARDHRKAFKKARETL
jgi:antitoxin ParD1/3/4